MELEGVRIMLLKAAHSCFGVEVCQVGTLRRKDTLFPPREGGPADLLGFLPLGGRAVPVLDLGTRLGLSSNGVKRMGFLIVTSLETLPIAFRVDQIEGPIDAAWTELSLLPRMLQTLQSKSLIWGMLWRENRLVPLLDLQRLLAQEEAVGLLELGRVYEGGHDGRVA